MYTAGYVITFGLQLIIIARFASRFGFSPGWAAVAILPLGPLILAWIVALSSWDFPDAKELASHDSAELEETFE